MSLRIRLTLVVAVTFAVVVVGCVYAAHLSASRQLRSETDKFLLQRSTRFANTPPGEFPENDGDNDGDDKAQAETGPALADPDAVTADPRRARQGPLVDRGPARCPSPRPTGSSPSTAATGGSAT